MCFEDDKSYTEEHFINGKAPCKCKRRGNDNVQNLSRKRKGLNSEGSERGLS